MVLSVPIAASLNVAVLFGPATKLRPEGLPIRPESVVLFEPSNVLSPPVA